jgi:pimeloyl-ACP methyl ester carboxylesterase
MQTDPRLESVQCLSPAGLHRMGYAEWGDPANPKVLICAHGVSRVGRDFDVLAQALSDVYRVVCPDVAGRGRSDWLRDPQYYQIPQYVADMVTLIARLNAGSVHWLGTSMGGMIGMSLASLPGSPISKIVINDVGPHLNAPALVRIGDYLGQPVRFADFDAAVDYIAFLSAPFGPHTREEWSRLTRYVVRQDGAEWILHYDPRIALGLKGMTPEAAAAGEALLWAAYDAIACPALLVRGAQSDLLTAQTAAQMTQRGPRARLVEFAGVGHAPTFLHADQIAVVRDFLLQETN